MSRSSSQSSLCRLWSPAPGLGLVDCRAEANLAHGRGKGGAPAAVDLSGVPELLVSQSTLLGVSSMHEHMEMVKMRPSRSVASSKQTSNSQPQVWQL